MNDDAAYYWIIAGCVSWHVVVAAIVFYDCFITKRRK
jgi:hypothetical protein